VDLVKTLAKTGCVLGVLGISYLVLILLCRSRLLIKPPRR
jgi:hypothetical protein